MTRILTAILLLAILAASLWLPPYAFAVVLAIFLAIAWSEYAGLAAEAGATPLRGLGGPLVVACALSFAAADVTPALIMLALAALLAAIGGLAAGRGHPTLAIKRAAATLGGIAWLGFLPGFCIALRFEENGVALIGLLFAAISSGDTAAYYGGSAFGRTPLAPHLSPKKTVEGALFGLVASGIGAALVTHYWIDGADWIAGFGVGMMLGVVGQAGDLFESSLKRAANSKDSSRLLPGHGSVLDRLDGVLFGGPVLYAAVYFSIL